MDTWECGYSNAEEIAKESNPDYHCNMGLELSKLHKYREAIIQYEIAIWLNPLEPKYHFLKGLTLKILKRYEESNEEFNIAIILDHSNPEFHKAKAEALLKLRHHKETTNEYKAAMEKLLKEILLVINPYLSLRDPNRMLNYAKIMLSFDEEFVGRERINEALTKSGINKEELLKLVDSEITNVISEKEKNLLLQIKELIEFEIEFETDPFSFRLKLFKNLDK
ncbi:hypothetical protein [Caldiplasma sukawensis]